MNDKYTDRVVLAGLRPLATGLVFIYAFYFVLNWWALGLATAAPVLASNAVLAAIFLALRIALGRGMIHPRYGDLTGAIVMSLVVSQVAFRFFITPRVFYTVYIGSALLAAGFFLSSRRWLALVVGGTFIVWTAVVWPASDSVTLLHLQVALLLVSFVAAFIQTGRLAGLQQLQEAVRTSQREAAERAQAEAVQTVLLSISQAVWTSNDLAELMETAHGELGKLIDTTNFFLALYDSKTDSYSFPYHVDEHDTSDTYRATKLPKSHTDYVRRTGEPLLADHAVHQRLAARGEVELVGTNSACWMGAPLACGGEVTGVVVVQSYSDESAYSTHDLEILTFVSGNIASAIERQQAQEALRTSEARYRNVVEDQSEFVVRWLPDGTRTFVNESYCRCFQKSREELIGSKLLPLVFGEDRPMIIEKIHGLTPGAPSASGEHRVILPDGTIGWQHWTDRAIFDDEGRIIEVQSVGRDITVRHKTEETLYFVAQRGWAEGGESFLGSLVEYLGEVLGVEHAFVGELLPSGSRVRTVGFHAAGGIAPDIEYDLADTPCAEVIGEKLCYHERDIQRLFPEDKLLEEMGAESYAGVPLWGSKGDPIGLVVVIHTEPLVDRELVESLLQIVAVRAARELERERYDKELRESERKFREVVENVPIGIAITTEEGVVVDANPSLVELHGYDSKAELLKVPAAAHFRDPEERNRLISLLDLGAVRGFEAELLRSDGSPVWASVTSVKHQTEDGIVRLFHAIEDISERRLADAALKKSEARLAEAQRTAHLGNWEWDLVDDSMSWSDETYRIFGRSPREFEPDYQAALAAVHMEDRDLVEQAFDDAMRHEAPCSVDHRIVLPDGSERVVHGEALVTFDESGRPIRMAGTVQDVTDRAHLEQKLRQALKMEAVGQLAGGVAHDFNNLLTGITGYTQLALGKGSGDASASADLRRVLDCALRAASLTRQLLAFSRQQPLEIRVFNLNTLVENTSNMLRRLIGEDIETELTAASELGNVSADEGEIEQVLLNLAINARDAMPDGGQLTIETANATLDEAYCASEADVEPGNYVMLAVTDTGFGMDERTQKQIFEPFFTTKELGKGTGLGLSTVYGIVKQHDGHIAVYSEPDRGTTFKVYLPQVEAEISGSTTVGDPADADAGTEAILIVEDDEAVREVVARGLERRGYRVLTASHPDEAEHLFRAHADEIDLLVTDIVLPGVDGTTLYERLCEDHSDVSVLYMSGYPASGITRMRDLDPDAHFLQKPFTTAQLTRMVRTVLDD